MRHIWALSFEKNCRAVCFSGDCNLIVRPKRLSAAPYVEQDLNIATKGEFGCRLRARFEEAKIRAFSRM